MIISKTRRPAVAGSFYPDEPKELKRMVDSFLSCDIKPLKWKISGILVPHAGYVYSGATAGRSFAAIKNCKFDTAIILAISHRYTLEGAALYSGCAFDTPLGSVCVNGKLTEKIKKSHSLFEFHDSAHNEEHSIEVQLPFLQTLHPDAEIVPVLVNTNDLDALKKIGTAIGKIAKENNAMLIVSSDLAHYPPADISKKSDMSVLTALSIALQYKDPAYFKLANRLLLEKRFQGLETTACGESAILIGIYSAMEQGVNDFEFIDYTNSGDTKGTDNFAVVGYGAGAFVKSDKPKNHLRLSSEQKQKLLDIARESIIYHLEHNKMRETDLSPEAIFNVPAAVFVTLHKKGALRGCIGSLQAEGLLACQANKYACLAALEDPRFSPVTETEMEDINIEISILSPLQRIKKIDEIVERKHGVFVRQGLKSGTYLPQVWEHFNTKKEFINSLLAEKTGLPANALKDPKTKLYIYTVESFGE